MTAWSTYHRTKLATSNRARKTAGISKAAAPFLVFLAFEEEEEAEVEEALVLKVVAEEEDCVEEEDELAIEEEEEVSVELALELSSSLWFSMSSSSLPQLSCVLIPVPNGWPAPDSK